VFFIVVCSDALIHSFSATLHIKSYRIFGLTRGEEVPNFSTNDKRQNREGISIVQATPQPTTGKQENRKTGKQDHRLVLSIFGLHDKTFLPSFLSQSLGKERTIR
jgi:hypothetical protein